MDILTTAFRCLGYPHFFIRRALSHAKTKFHALPPPPAPPSIHTTKPKVIVLPYQPVLARLNPIMQSANYKFVFNYRDTIGRAVVNCKGSLRISKHQKPGVYRIPCTFPGCEQPYFGRTMKPLKERLHEHSLNFRSSNPQKNAMIEHSREHPGHRFDLTSARLIWNTHNKYESKIVEAACINRFSSCNISQGEVRVTNAMSTFFTRIANIHVSATSDTRQQHRPLPLYVSRPAPQSQPVSPASTPPAPVDIHTLPNVRSPLSQPASSLPCPNNTHMSPHPRRFSSQPTRPPRPTPTQTYLTTLPSPASITAASAPLPPNGDGSTLATSQPHRSAPPLQDMSLHIPSASQPVNLRRHISGNQRSLDSPIALRPRPPRRPHLNH